jgi:hypothetical protein
MSAIGTIIKLGPAQRVDAVAGLVRARQKVSTRKKLARPGLTQVTRPNPGETRYIYINSSDSGNLGKQKESWSFCPNFFLWSLNNQEIFFYWLNLLAPYWISDFTTHIIPFLSFFFLSESCRTLHQWSEKEAGFHCYKPSTSSFYFAMFYFGFNCASNNQ